MWELLGDDRGAVMVEYALVLSLLSMGFIGGMQLIEKATYNTLIDVTNRLEDYGLEITP